MKRAGNLIGQIVELENLRVAFWKAAKAKRGRMATHRFGSALEENLAVMSRELASGGFEFGRYRRFRVFDPKERVIHAAAFPERVAHHAVMNVCEPVLERASIFDSYACRVGKGRPLAVARAQEYAQRYPWFLKMDVRKYFDSIPQSRLLALLEGKFKDKAVLGVFRQIIGSYAARGDGVELFGLPIGSLCSQHWANFYLGTLDRFATETLRAGGYVRYMDDFVLWHAEKDWLRDAQGRLEAFLQEKLGLVAKEAPFINRTALGMDFLGSRIFPGTVRLNRRSKVRFLRKVRGLEKACERGEISEATLQQRATCLVAFVAQSESAGFRRAAGICKDVDGGQPARTASSAAGHGTTTRTTRNVPTATTTGQPTRTTTLAFARPELAPVGWISQPEDNPATAPLGERSKPTNTKNPPGAGSQGWMSTAKAPGGSVCTLNRFIL